MVNTQLHTGTAAHGRSAKSERTCVVCGRRDAPRAFARVVCAPDGEMVVDWRRNLPGRGAHLCVSRSCVEKAVEQRLLGRVLKREVRYPSRTQLLATMRNSLTRQLETLISKGVGARFVVVGADLTSQALKTDKTYCIVVAADSAGRDRLADFAASKKVSVAMVDTKRTLGCLLGRGETGAVAVTERGLANAILLISSRIEALR